MTPEQFQVLRESFERAKSLAGAALVELVTTVRARDPEVAEELEAMLGSRTQTGFLEPAVATVTFAIRDAQSGKTWHMLRGGDLIAERYEIGEVLGEGAFGKVYLAKDRRLDYRRVVLKILKPFQHSWHEKRFQEEIRALARLDHSGIVGVTDSGKLDDGSAYLVMQYVPGKTLADVVKDQALDPDRALKLLKQVCEPLAAAHEAGILHRDLKPANILVRDAGKPDERAVLIDFGIARTDSDGTSEAMTTFISGTPRYMPPEQMMGRTSAASDLFSLGLVGIEMCTGKALDRRGPELDLRPAARAALSNVSPALPSNAVDAIVKCISHAPEDRHASVRDFATALSTVEVATPAPLTAPPAQSRRSLLLPLGALAAIAIVGLAVFLSQKPAPNASPVTLSTTIAKRAATSNSPPIPLQPNAVLRAGDGVELVFQSSAAGHLYVFDESGSQFAVLFPGADRPSAPLAANVLHRVPESPDDWLAIDGQSREELLWLVWTPQPVPELDELQKYSRPPRIGAVPAPETQALREFLARQPNANKDLRGSFEWHSPSGVVVSSIPIHVR